MKRLIKKSKYEDFIQEWYNSWGGVSDNEVDNIIKNNPEFKYSGSAWRWIGLNDLKTIILSNVKIHEDEDQNFLDYNEIVNIAKKYIHNDTKYVSWCQFYEDVELYAQTRIEEYNDTDFGVIIEANIKGLNYYDFLLKYDPDMASVSKEENEAIGKSDSFQIVGLTIKRDGTMYLYDNDDPCEIYYNDNNIVIK